MLHARNRGVQTILIHALSENTAMLRLAIAAGAIVEREGSESEARLRLPPDSFVSHLDEVLVEQAAELDYRLKRHAHRPEHAPGAAEIPDEAPAVAGRAELVPADSTPESDR
jgi:hypothetical protein